MVTYVVRLDWPAERTPGLDGELLLKQLVDHQPVVGAGRMAVDGDATPWTVSVCIEGRTPRLAAINALGVVEGIIGIRVTGFRVEDSDSCEQLADVRDAVPDLVNEDTLRGMLSVDAARFAELAAEPGFPPVVVSTPYGDLWDLAEVQDWTTP